MMKLGYITLIFLCLGCYKKHEDIEAIPIRDIQFKTTLKDHTPGVDYIINKTLEVSKELIIEAGVEIVIEEGCGISVRDSGSIHINGSSGHPVVFKAKNNSGRWNGISVSSPLDNQMQHAEISGAGLQGENHAALEIRPSGHLSLSNCKISDNGNASALLLSENADCKIESCEFTKNKFPIQMDLYATLQISNGNFKGNENDMVCVYNQDGSSLFVKRDLNISNPGMPYYFTSSLLLNINKVTINAGVSMLFNRNAGINTVSNNAMNPLLLVNGTSGSPVTMGSFYAGENDLWRGVMLSSGYHKIYNTIFKKAYTGSKNLGTLSLYAYTNIDCKYCTFNADKDFCNISIFGPSVGFNTDIFTRNTFTNALLPCVIL
jgi:hypothetical protein